MNQLQYILKFSKLKSNSIKETLILLKDGATIPFIARYRKEQTNNLDEVQIALIQELGNKYTDIVKRKEYIIKTVSEITNINQEFRNKIDSCWDVYTLEDYYLPYKKKRITKGEKAKKAGLTPLAKIIMKQNNGDPHHSAQMFINKDYNSTNKTIEGAQHIIADWINENIIVRDKLRNSFIEHGQITTKEVNSKKKLTEKLEIEKSKFKDLLNHTQRLSHCSSHRFLAILRAENKNYLRIKIEPNKEYTIQWLQRFYCKNDNTNSKLVKQAINDAYKRLLQPSLETETKQFYKNSADDKSINIFSKNLETILLAPPIGSKSILALDPGFRTGCKLICINKNGDLVHNSTIYPNEPRNDKINSKKHVEQLISKYAIEAIAIGDGTAGRETEKWIKSFISKDKAKVYVVREDGASIYSASNSAREEFPNHDITVRGAVSIARRLADPLSELVKIDPKSLGIGQYQHDVNKTKLKNKLDLVVESCVNKVGVNVNTASKYLLTYVSGLGIKTAESIIQYRKENGLIKSREELKQIPKMGKKSFEQSAGFLKIPISKNQLDNTSIHPENYKLVSLLTNDLNLSLNQIVSNNTIIDTISTNNYKEKYTIIDILKELKKPGIDPREENTTFEFSSNISTIEDINIGLEIVGIITNVTDFGAFVNIGIKENGLVHKSKFHFNQSESLTNHVSIGQKIKVNVIDIDKKRQRIALSTLK